MCARKEHQKEGKEVSNTPKTSHGILKKAVEESLGNGKFWVTGTVHTYTGSHCAIGAIEDAACLEEEYSSSGTKLTQEALIELAYAMLELGHPLGQEIATGWKTELDTKIRMIDRAEVAQRIIYTFNDKQENPDLVVKAFRNAEKRLREKNCRK